MKNDVENKITNRFYDDIQLKLNYVETYLEKGKGREAKIMIKTEYDSLEIMRSRELRKNELEEELFEKLKKTESKWGVFVLFSRKIPVLL